MIVYCLIALSRRYHSITMIMLLIFFPARHGPRRFDCFLLSALTLVQYFRIRFLPSFIRSTLLQFVTSAFHGDSIVFQVSSPETTLCTRNRCRLQSWRACDKLWSTTNSKQNVNQSYWTSSSNAFTCILVVKSFKTPSKRMESTITIKIFV